MLVRASLTVLALVAVLAPACATARSEAAKCPTLDPSFARGGEILKMLRAFTGPDGKSKIETIDLKGKTATYYGGKVSLTQFGFGDPTNVVIVYGSANMDIPVHPSPYREIFLIVSGSSTVVLPDGTEHQLTPGTLFLSEDQDSTGRGGRSGPCGYVAIDFQYKSAK
jgi:hypothetical protein